MHAPEQEKNYPERLSFRTSKKGLAAVLAEAKVAGKSKGEVVRDLVEEWAKGEPSGRVVLAELLSLRTILLTMLMEQNRCRLAATVFSAEEMRDAGEFTDEVLTSLVDRADKVKFAKADRAIVEGRQG